MLVRIRFRIGSHEGSFEDFFKAEFCDKYNGYAPDLKLSVYRVELSELVRVAAEHAAGIPLGYRNLRHFDISSLASFAVQTPGCTGFHFADGAHHELMLPDDRQLRAFAASIYEQLQVEPADPPHALVTKKRALERYEATRVAAGDVEWLHHPRRRRS